MTIPTSAWLAATPPRPNARVRLFCLPYAGGGASIYRSWPDALPDDIAVLPVQLPGRENRMAEPPITRLRLLVALLAQALRPHLTEPYAFFGHSMGALLAFELTRHLRRQRVPLPVHLFLSGRRAPTIEDTDEPAHTLPHDAFVARLRELDGTPEAVLAHPELMELVLPTLRADFAVCETYTYTAEPPLACGLTVFGGTDDSSTPLEQLDDWATQTTGPAQVLHIPGGHFFINTSARSAVLDSISATLHSLVHQPAL